jgi:HAD superfamily hydrolase (TIGR01490 family)
VLAVFDLDGTITRHDTLLPFVLGFLARHPWRLPRLITALPTVLAYAFGRADRGALKGALIHSTFGGLSREAVTAAATAHVQSVLRNGLFAEALERIAFHRSQGHHLVLMSASPDIYVPQLGTALGFNETICSRVRWRTDGRLDGRLAGENCRGNEKLRQLHLLLQRLSPVATWAYGNSSADLPHMRLASAAQYVMASRTADFPQVQLVRWRQRATWPG